MPAPPVNKIKSGQKYESNVEKKANEILINDNVIDYIVKVANIIHKSDQNLFKIAILSTIQHAVSNYDYGLYINIVGSAGKGKSHGLNTLTKLLPDDWVLPFDLYYTAIIGNLLMFLTGFFMSRVIFPRQSPVGELSVWGRKKF